MFERIFGKIIGTLTLPIDLIQDIITAETDGKYPKGKNNAFRKKMDYLIGMESAKKQAKKEDIKFFLDILDRISK